MIREMYVKPISQYLDLSTGPEPDFEGTLKIRTMTSTGTCKNLQRMSDWTTSRKTHLGLRCLEVAGSQFTANCTSDQVARLALAWRSLNDTPGALLALA